MELDRTSTHQATASTPTIDQPAPTPERLQRRATSGGSVPAPTTSAPFPLASSALAVQLFADAVNAGVNPAEQVQRAAAHGLSGASSALPHLATIQRAFGRHDVSGVQAHVGGRAAEGAAAIGAHGYASGNAVAFASSPDVHLAAHEAAHVVQQRAGVQLKGGVGEVGDPYERHADAVADLVVQGKSAESLLDMMAPFSASGGVQRNAIQMGGPDAGPARPGASPIVAPTDATMLARYAHSIHGHLHDPPTSLVPYARALDAQLQAGAFTNPTDARAVIDALIAIHRVLHAQPPAALAAFRSAGSPMDGVVEDIAPFGNLDMWTAERSALARRPPPHPTRTGHDPTPTPTPAPTLTPMPTPTPTPTDDLGPGARLGGDLLVHALDANHDSTAGDTANAIDAGGMGYDLAEMLGMGFSGFLGEVAMPLLSPILQTFSLLLAMDDARQQTDEGRTAAGMRIGIYELDHYWSPYPQTLTAALLEQHASGSEEYRRESGTSDHPIVSYESDGRIPGLLRRGFAQVAAAVNGSVNAAEAWHGVREALARTPELAERIHQDVRHAVYTRIVQIVREHGVPGRTH